MFIPETVTTPATAGHVYTWDSHNIGDSWSCLYLRQSQHQKQLVMFIPETVTTPETAGHVYT